MIQEIAAVLAAPKQAADIAKEIKAPNVDFEVKTKTSELLSAIIDLENSMLELQGRFGALSKFEMAQNIYPKDPPLKFLIIALRGDLGQGEGLNGVRCLILDRHTD